MAPVRSLLAAAAIVAAGAAVAGCGKQPAAATPLNLTVWGVNEPSGAVATLVASVTAGHPGVRISYVQKDPATYEGELVAALAAGRGPDIFAFPAGQVERWKEFLQPAPASYTLPAYQLKRTLLSRQQVAVAQEYAGLTPRQVESRFVRTVANDSLADGRIYGLPLAVDTLVLAYNQALLDSSRVAQVPGDWVSFKDAVAKLTQRDGAGNFQQSGAAIGTGSNVTNAAALASLLMLQGGVAFPVNEQPELASRADPSPAGEALRFYSEFSQSSRETYTWGTRLPRDTEALAAGRVAMAFLTPSQVAQVRKQQPGLPLAAAAVPQLNESSPVAVADYWLYGVARASREGQRAWGMLQQLATADGPLAAFAVAAERGPALRSVAAKLQASDQPTVAALADQALVAQPWFYGYDRSGAERAFAGTLDRLSTSSLTLEQAVAELNRQLRLAFQRT